MASGMLLQRVMACELEQGGTEFLLADSRMAELELESMADARSAKNTLEDAEDEEDEEDSLVKVLSTMARSVESFRWSASTDPISQIMSFSASGGGRNSCCLEAHARRYSLEKRE